MSSCELGQILPLHRSTKYSTATGLLFVLYISNIYLSCASLILYNPLTVVKFGVLYRIFLSVICTVSPPLKGLGIYLICNVAIK